MGVKFSKEMILASSQIVPPVREPTELSAVQRKLVKKFGKTNAFPFVFNFPPNSPSSVTLQPGDDDSGKPLGVEYNIRTYVSDREEDKGNQRSSIVLAIKKVSAGRSELVAGGTNYYYYYCCRLPVAVTIRSVHEGPTIAELVD